MALTSGFTYSCNASAVGGVQTLYIANQSDINATVGSTCTALTKVGSVGFFAITFEDDGCSFTEAIEVSNNRVVYKPEYKVKIGHRTAAARTFISTLTGCDRYMIGHIERATTEKWLTGYTSTQGMRLISGTSQTGNVMSDENMIELTFGHPTGVQYPSVVLASGVNFPT
jgi:hypothetical protein